jgi:hypothetical protein
MVPARLPDFAQAVLLFLMPVTAAAAAALDLAVLDFQLASLLPPFIQLKRGYVYYWMPH